MPTYCLLQAFAAHLDLVTDALWLYLNVTTSCCSQTSLALVLNVNRADLAAQLLSAGQHIMRHNEIAYTPGSRCWFAQDWHFNQERLCPESIDNIFIAMCTSDDKYEVKLKVVKETPYPRWNPDIGSGDGLKIYGWRSGWDEVDCGELALSTGYDELEGNGVEDSRKDCALKRQLTTAEKRTDVEVY